MSDAQANDDTDSDAEHAEWSRLLDRLDARATAAEERGDPREIAETHRLLAEHVHGIADADVMIDLLLTARQAYQEFDAEMAMRCAISIGEVAQDHGDFETARDALWVVCEESAEIGDEDRFVESLNDFGCMAMQTGDFADADDAFRQAIEIYRSRGSVQDVVEVRLNLANNYRMSGRRDQAEREFIELGEMAGDNERLTAVCAESLAGMYAESNRPHLARSAFEKSIMICERLGDEDHAYQGRMGLAWVLMSTGEWRRGDALMTLVRDYFIETEQPDKVAVCEYNRANALAARGEYTAADDAFAAAAEGLAAAGMHHQLANLEWNRVKRLTMEAAANPLRQRTLGAEAIDVAVSSLIAADYERFQFTDTRRRAEWNATLEHRITWTFILAYKLGSKELTADLIDTVINAGVYGMSGSPDADDLAPLDMTPARRVPPEEMPGVSSSTAWTLGAAGLLSTSELPLAPPPALIDGNGRELLARQRRMAAALDPDLSEILTKAPKVPVW